MSALMPQGLRDCLTLSLCVHGTTWTSSDGRLSVGVTERITRTAQEFVASQSGRLGVDNPADDALFKALLSIANADAIDATTVNPDLNRMLGALMETLVGGPALDAADLAEHMREFQMLGLAISDEPRPRSQSAGTRHPSGPLSSRIRPENCSGIFFSERLFRGSDRFP